MLQVTILSLISRKDAPDPLSFLLNWKAKSNDDKYPFSLQVYQQSAFGCRCEVGICYLSLWIFLFYFQNYLSLALAR